MAKHPNPNKPAEAEEILHALAELHKCQQNGRYDLAALDKWLNRYPDQMAAAAERLDHALEVIYPMEEVVHEYQHRTAV